MRTVTASLLAALVLLAVSAPARANVIQTTLGNSGWTVSGNTNGSVGLAVDREGTDPDGKRFVAIEIIKVFRDPPDPRTQVVPAIALNFVQSGSAQTPASRIYISDESITNLTGVRWLDFHWVIGVTDTARFNRELTNPTTDPQTEGWQIGPFTRFNWVDGEGSGTETLSVAGGGVNNGASFFPGLGLGNLVIDIVGSDRGGSLTFTLKEIPTIPEPASLLLITAGAAIVVLKRRGTRI
jgi:hypothetical protein